MEALRRLAPIFAPSNRKGAKFMSDVIFISLGLALIGVMALYAHALTRA